MNAIATPLHHVDYLWDVRGYGTRNGARVLILDGYIHAPNKALAIAAFVRKHESREQARLTDVVAESVKQVIDVERSDVERLTEELRATRERLASMTRRCNFALPEICILVNRSFDNDPTDDEDLVVPIEAAERAVMKLCEAHESELRTLAAEEIDV